MVIGAALAEIVERGYAAASVPSIARRAGMSNSSVYYHFSSKEDIVLALMDGIGGELRSLAADAVDPVELLRSYLAWMRANPLHAKLYHASAVGASVSLEARRRSDQTELVRVISDRALASLNEAVEPAERTVMAIAIVTLFAEATSAVYDSRLPDGDVDARAEELLAGLLAIG